LNFSEASLNSNEKNQKFQRSNIQQIFNMTKAQIKNYSNLANEGFIFPTSQSKNVKKLKLKVGDISTVTIKALGTKNVGLAEISNGYTVLVPKSKLGETVKIEIQKISLKPKYATGKLIEVLKESKFNVPVQVDEVLDVTIEKQGPQNSGLYSLENNFTIIIEPISKEFGLKVGEKTSVKITRVKENYAFGKPFDKNFQNQNLKSTISTSLNSELRMANNLRTPLKLGSSYDLKLPLNAKVFNNYVAVKLKNSLLFIQLGLGAQLGETVRIQIVKTSPKHAIAKITKISPMAKNSKNLLVKNEVKKMITSGMHYGEKAIRCHANMRKFLWIRKKGKNKNRPFMKRGRHVLNVLKTRTCLNKALHQLAKYAAKGKTFLFVGTKKPAASLIARTAMLTKTSYFVNTRWLGGMLTNWKTILKSISQIRPILKEKQKMIQKILEKRQKIKKRLFKKVNLLRKKSEKLLVKGKQLLTQIRQDRKILLTRTQKLLTKKSELISKNKQLLTKYSQLQLQKQKFAKQGQLLQKKGNDLLNQKRSFIQQIQITVQALEEFKKLNTIGEEVFALKEKFQTEQKTIVAVPFENFMEMVKTKEVSTIPNPSTAILNKLINVMKLKYEKNSFTNSNPPMNFETSQSKNRAKATASQTVVISQLLNKLTDYLPFVQFYIQTLTVRLQTLETLCKNVDASLQKIRTQFNVFNNPTVLSNIETNLNLIKTKLDFEFQNLNSLKRKLKQLAAEQKLLKFLPKLRYLPTSKKKMLETVEFLMKKFVDPKMSYSMDQIYNQKLKFTSKKLAATRKQKWQRLEKYFGGITKMAKMKRKQITNNVVILIGQQEEMNAVRECRKLGMKLFTIVDTNCNPRLSDYIIPANDDSRNSIQFVLGQMLTYIRLGQKLRKKILLKRAI
jgi:ribosomal protein S2